MGEPAEDNFNFKDYLVNFYKDNPQSQGHPSTNRARLSVERGEDQVKIEAQEDVTMVLEENEVTIEDVVVDNVNWEKRCKAAEDKLFSLGFLRIDGKDGVRWEKIKRV